MRTKPTSTDGYVYARKRKSDGAIKIGYSKRPPQIRNRELVRQHGELKTVYCQQHRLYRSVEGWAHYYLHRHRYGRTEWFKVTIKAAITAIEMADNRMKAFKDWVPVPPVQPLAARKTRP